MTGRLALIVATIASLTACRTLQVEEPATLAGALVQGINAGDAHEVAGLFDDQATAYLPFGTSTLLVGRASIEQTLSKLLGGTKANLKADNVRVDRVADDVVVVTFGLLSDQVSSRRTIVARLEGSRWKIVHLHASNIRGAGAN